MPLKIGSGQDVSAVLQVVVNSPAETTPRTGRLGRPRVREELEGVRDVNNHNEQTGMLSDSQITGLQLLCGTTAGLIDMRLQVAVERDIKRRAEDCLAIAAEISSVPRLTDFEQKVKILLMKFFNVAGVRLCFYDQDTLQLITTPVGPHRKNQDASQTAYVGLRRLLKIPVQEGLVGKCARRLRILHVERAALSADLSERADGMDLSGHSAEVNMLVGPMMAHLPEGTMLIGTLQLIEKKHNLEADSLKAATAKPGAGENDQLTSAHCEPFSDEDQTFFGELLKILGLAAYRTMQSQARGDSGDVAIHVEKLLE